MKGFTTYSFVTAVIVSSLLAFSVGAQSAEASASADKQQVKKPAHTQAAPVASAINLNKADVQTLAQLNGVGEKKAKAIIAYREANGGFKSVDDLLNVKGVGEKILEKNRALLSVN